MPVYLKDISKFTELERSKSVLIVPCRFCPAASFAVRKNEPYFEFLRKLLQTSSYEQYINEIRSALEKKGVRAGVFKSHWPHQFVICMWTSRRRKKLKKQAAKYDDLVVMGCEAAVQTVYDSVKSTSCKVFQGMRTEGIMSIKPQFQFPSNILLQLDSITPILHQEMNVDSWVRL
jgi:hypothetical protein